MGSFFWTRTVHAFIGVDACIYDHAMYTVHVHTIHVDSMHLLWCVDRRRFSFRTHSLSPHLGEVTQVIESDAYAV